MIYAVAGTAFLIGLAVGMVIGSGEDPVGCIPLTLIIIAIFWLGVLLSKVIL